MPAMKLPSTPAPPPRQEAPAPAPEPEAPKEEVQAEAGDAYNATVLGMAAVDPNAPTSDGPPSEQLEEEDRPTTGSDIASSPPQAAAAMDSFSANTDVEAAVPSQPQVESRLPDNSIPMWIPAAILGVMAVIVIVLAIFVF